MGGDGQQLLRRLNRQGIAKTPDGASIAGTVIGRSSIHHFYFHLLTVHPVQSEAYGVFPWLADLLTFSSWAVVLVTYFTVIVQIAFPFLLFHRVTRRIALVSILAMHLGIAVVMGLPFFSGIMASADAVLVGGATWVTIAAWGRARFSGLRARLGAKKPGKRSTTHGQHHPAESESVSV